MNTREVNRKIILAFFVVLFLAAFSFAFYSTFFSSKECNSFECFEREMRECKKASYINEEPEASWKYQIEKSDNGKCLVRVTLLQAKQGELGIDRLEGMSMVCSHALGFSSYPHKDLAKCSGQLREELQGIIINKLHSYLIGNLWQINESIAEYGL